MKDNKDWIECSSSTQPEFGEKVACRYSLTKDDNGNWSSWSQMTNVFRLKECNG